MPATNGLPDQYERRKKGGNAVHTEFSAAGGKGGRVAEGGEVPLRNNLSPQNTLGKKKEGGGGIRSCSSCSDSVRSPTKRGKNVEQRKKNKKTDESMKNILDHRKKGKRKREIARTTAR